MSQQPFNYDQLTELCGAARDERLTPAQFDRLQQMLSQHEEARTFYSRFMQLHGLLEQRVSVDAEVKALDNVREHIRNTMAEAELGKELNETSIDGQLKALRQKTGEATARAQLEALKQARKQRQAAQ